MTEKPSAGIASEFIDTEATRTLEELCLSCDVEADWIAELVEHGVVEPTGQTRSDWQFSSVSIVRLAKAKRLERDLNLNPPGVALVLDLLDEIERLRCRLRSFQGPGARREEEQL